MTPTDEQIKEACQFISPTQYDTSAEYGLVIARAVLALVDKPAAPNLTEHTHITDEAAAEILVAMREHMLTWGEALDDTREPIDIEDDDNALFPSFAGECIRFIAKRLQA